MIDRAELIISMQKGVNKLYELQNNKKYEDKETIGKYSCECGEIKN